MSETVPDTIIAHGHVYDRRKGVNAAGQKITEVKVPDVPVQTHSVPVAQPSKHVVLPVSTPSVGVNWGRILIVAVLAAVVAYAVAKYKGWV
jgi:hypothetical protein